MNAKQRRMTVKLTD